MNDDKASEQQRLAEHLYETARRWSEWLYAGGPAGARDKAIGAQLDAARVSAEERALRIGEML